MSVLMSYVIPSKKIFSNETVSIDPLGAGVGVVSALVMLGRLFLQSSLSNTGQIKSLKKRPQRQSSDVVTSLGTSIAIAASAFNYPIVDKIAAIIITFFIPQNSLRYFYGIFLLVFQTALTIASLEDYEKLS